MYLSHVCTGLSDGSEELNSGHPLVEAEAGFAGEIVQVCYETFHDVLEAGIVTLRVNAVDIFGNVLDSQVLQDRS
jgi:hypothetical protein